MFFKFGKEGRLRSTERWNQGSLSIFFDMDKPSMFKTAQNIGHFSSIDSAFMQHLPNVSIDQRLAARSEEHQEPRPVARPGEHQEPTHGSRGKRPMAQTVFV